MSPLDYVPPVAVESQAVAPDAVADELEWVKLESECIRFGSHLVPTSNHRVIRGVNYWTQCTPTGTGPRIHPKGYRIKGENAGLPSRAKSVADACRQLDAFTGSTFRYLPPMHTCRMPSHLIAETPDNA